MNMAAFPTAHTQTQIPRAVQHFSSAVSQDLISHTWGPDTIPHSHTHTHTHTHTHRYNWPHITPACDTQPQTSG